MFYYWLSSVFILTNCAVTAEEIYFYQVMPAEEIRGFYQNLFISHGEAVKTNTRKLERVTEKLASVSNKITFLHQCIDEKVTPTCLGGFSLQTFGVKSEKTLEDFKQNFLRSSLADLKTQKQSLTRQKAAILQFLESEIDRREDFNGLVCRIRSNTEEFLNRPSAHISGNSLASLGSELLW